MHPAERAETHLRAIRALMERATLYRALAAPTALVGGTLATLTGGVMWWWWLHRGGLGPRRFVAIWMLVCAATCAAQLLFLRFNAERSGEPLFSTRFRTAARDMLPAFLAAAAFTLCHYLSLLQDGAPVFFGLGPLVVFWMVFYGLALLATEEYAPKSLVVLGWAFLIAGLVFAALFYTGFVFYDGGAAHAAILMGSTFGLFHLAYAVCAWPRNRAATPGAQP